MEPCRLRLVGRVSRVAARFAERRLDRHLWAELPDRAGGRPAFPVRNAVAATAFRVATGGSGNRRAAADRGAGDSRRGAAASVADRLAPDLASTGTDLAPATPTTAP